MTESRPAETLEMFLDSVRPGETRTGMVAGFDGQDVILDLDGAQETHRAAGVVPWNELSRSSMEDPAKVFTVGRAIQVEVIYVDRRHGQVVASARACANQALRDFILARRPGDIVTGTVAEVHDFGVFVNLDGEPVDPLTGYSGTGFIRVPELSCSHINDIGDVVHVGQRIAAEVFEHRIRPRSQTGIELLPEPVEFPERLVHQRIVHTDHRQPLVR